VSAIQQTPNSSTQAASSQAGAANAAENAQIRQLANTRANDAQALRDDIRKMRALVGQMQTNLAFVDTTQSPLKHQFQLDIDMWNILISQMERRSYSNSR
jgi:alkanesulfonate monooxygenase SsuD/methylene tetrahydromethanopterin reductase-like flavin-dependent oxidoreductase (luciferase family)